jgi:hypothetical protein
MGLWGGHGFGGYCVTESPNGSQKKPGLGEKQPKGVAAAMRRTVIMLRRMFGSDVPENLAEAREAVSHFLGAMHSVAARTYPAWNRILIEGLSEHSLTYEESRALLEIHPIDDYYFAGVVAMDAVRIRQWYSADESTELLGEIGDQVDGAVHRQDRVVSDLVFKMIGRVDLNAEYDPSKAPYDKIVKTILQQMGVHKNALTRPLMNDKGYRHLLGEPLAVGVPHWWRDFHSKFSIYWDEPEEMDEDELDMALHTLAAQNAAPAPRRRVRKRALSFLGH